MVLDMGAKKKYEITAPGGEKVTVLASDSRDARRKAISQIRKDKGTDYKDSALNVRCLEGQPAKAPAYKPEKPAKQTASTQQNGEEIPPIQTVVVWALYYISKGIDWMNQNS